LLIALIISIAYIATEIMQGNKLQHTDMRIFFLVLKVMLKENRQPEYLVQFGIGEEI